MNITTMHISGKTNMNITTMMLAGRNVTIHHQGGYLLCVEHDGEKLRLSREELDQVESYIGGLLTADDLLIDIMRIVCQLQNMGKVISFNLRHRIQGAASNIDISVFNDHEGFETWLYDDVPPPFNSFTTWSNDDLLPLQVLRTNLQKLAVIDVQA